MMTQTALNEWYTLCLIPEEKRTEEEQKGLIRLNLEVKAMADHIHNTAMLSWR